LNDELICLDLETGTLVWNFPSPRADVDFEWTQAPAIAGTVVLFGGLDGLVYALDAKSGIVVWTLELGSRISTSLNPHGDDIYFGAANGVFYRASLETGEITASYKTPSIPVGRSTIVDDKVIVFLNSWGGPGRAKQLIALDLSLEQELWSTEPPFVWSSTKPRIWNDQLLTGTETDGLVACSLEDGGLQWSFPLEGEIRSIGSDGEVLFVGTRDGMLYAVVPLE
jgi:outer membrane protein assembly factor BamB